MRAEDNLALSNHYSDEEGVQFTGLPPVSPSDNQPAASGKEPGGDRAQPILDDSLFIASEQANPTPLAAHAASSEHTSEHVGASTPTVSIAAVHAERGALGINISVLSSQLPDEIVSTAVAGFEQEEALQAKALGSMLAGQAAALCSTLDATLDATP